MSRLRTALFFLGVFCLALAVLFTAAPAAPAGAQNIMQCMEQCIRHEGGNSAANKETCKSRCANVPMGKRAGPRDCMANFKSCRTGCAKDKKCVRACKKRLNSCV